MSAKDISDIKYVATLIHRKNGVRSCRCFHCDALARVVRLAERGARRITESKKEKHANG